MHSPDEPRPARRNLGQLINRAIMFVLFSLLAFAFLSRCTGLISPNTQNLEASATAFSEGNQTLAPLIQQTVQKQIETLEARQTPQVIPCYADAVLATQVAAGDESSGRLTPVSTIACADLTLTPSASETRPNPTPVP
jgi:hypothetical protein